MINSTKTQTADTLDELSRLALKYGTDKWGRRHHYTPVYYNLFKDRQKSVKKVLEIGIDKGASLRMWQDFFPNAKIYGVDYRKDLLIQQNRIKSFLYDQRREPHLIDLIDKISPDIDLVIDDASHRPHDQVFTCLTLMPLLKKGVIYIIEDIADPSIFEKLSLYDCEMFTVGRGYDDRIIIVRHQAEK